MRCRQCDYPLWNLAEPRCPECGTGFDLRSYRFTPGSVAFGCPYCGALHGGTGPHYLPSESDTATCQGCGQLMNVPAMRVVPLSDAAAAEDADDLPWRQRTSLGWFKAWYRTCFMAMTDPGRLGRQLGPGIPFASGYSFAVVTNLIASVANALFMLTCLGTMSAIGPQPGAFSQQQLNELTVQTIFQVAMVPLSFLFPLIAVAITGGVAHLVLLATGTTRNGFHTTAMAVLFAQGPLLLGVIPLCGGYVGAIWTMVATILVLRTAQGVGGFRATLAVLLASLLIMLLVFFVVAVFIAVVTA